MSSENELTIAAAKLARSAPENWKQFLGAFTSYTTTQTTNCIQSPLEELPRAQGRAQAIARLHGLLTDCLTSADKIESKHK